MSIQSKKFLILFLLVGIWQRVMSWISMKKGLETAAISSRKKLRRVIYFLYDVYQESRLPFVLGEYFAHFGDPSMMLNVSSYEPISVLPMGFFFVFSKCSYSIQEMGSAKFAQKNVSQHIRSIKPICCTFMVLLHNSIQWTLSEAKYLTVSED